MLESTEKMAYEAPQLIELGSFEQLTQSTASGGHYDAAARIGGLVTNLDQS